MKIKLRFGLVIGGTLLAIVLGTFGTAHGITSGNLMLTSANVASNRDLLTGASATTISVGLMGAGGSNVDNASVHIQLWQNGQLMREATYNNRDILHEKSMRFSFKPTNLAAGTYTLAVVVMQNGIQIASFGNIGSVTIGDTGSTGNGNNGGGNATSTTSGGATNGSVQIVSVDRIRQNLSEGNTATTITANLISPNGGNTNDVTVHIRLVRNGTVIADVPYAHQNILHEFPQGYRLATSANLAPGDYTIAVIVFNNDGSVNATFPNLGTITVVSGGTNTSNGTSTTNASTTSNPDLTMHIVANSGSVNATNVAPGTPVTMTVNYVNSDNANPFTGSIHMELFSSSETRITEQDFNNLTFGPGEMKTLQMTSPTNLSAGTYHFEDVLFFADGIPGGSDQLFGGPGVSLFTVSQTSPTNDLSATLGGGSDRSVFKVILGSQNIDLLSSANLRVQLIDASGTVGASQILNGNFVYSSSTGPARDYFWGAAPASCGTGLPPAGGTFHTRVIVMNQSSSAVLATFDNIGDQTFGPQPGCSAVMQ